MSAIATYPFYKEATRKIDCKIIKLGERLLTDGKVTATARIERARILRNVPIFQKSQYTRQLETVNANCNVAHLAECYILYKIPLLQYLQNNKRTQFYVSEYRCRCNLSKRTKLYARCNK